jgi:hypothetical protein
MRHCAYFSSYEQLFTYRAGRDVSLASKRLVTFWIGT